MSEMNTINNGFYKAKLAVMNMSTPDKAAKGRPVHVPLSGKTMQFDGNAKCTAGC